MYGGHEIWVPLIFSPWAWLVGLAIASALVLGRQVRVQGTADPSRYGRCDYDRTGLDSAMCCPECGSCEHRRVGAASHLELRRDRVTVWAFPAAIAIGVICFGKWLVTAYLVTRYVQEGYSAETALRVIPIRGEARGWMIALFPFAWSAVIAVGTAWIRERPAAYVIAFCIMLIGAIASVPYLPT